MRRCLPIFLNLLASSYSSSVEVPVCCQNGTSNFGDCEDKLEDPQSVFKRTWKNHDVEWRYAPVMCTNTTSYIDQDMNIDTYGNLVRPCSVGSCCGNPQLRCKADLTEENLGYCVDYLNGTLVAVMCVEEVDPWKRQENPTSWWRKPVITKVCWIISAVLLVITCALIMTEKSVKHETHAPYLISLCISYTSAFICILCVWFEIPQCWLCMLTGYSLQYFGLSAFFWMNAKCINVFMVISGRSVQRMNKTMLARLRWREFKISSLYAWGTPLLISATTYCLQMCDILDNFDNFKPDIGVSSCFLRKRTTKWIYFYGPMSAILVTNIILFAITTSVIAKHQISTIHLRKGRKSRVHKEIWFFNQYLKLFIITGICWVSGVVNWVFIDNTRPWLQTLSKITEILISLQGLFIFYFFVCQKKVLVKKLFCIPLLCSRTDRMLCTYQKRSVNECPSATQDTHSERHVALLNPNAKGTGCSPRNVKQEQDSETIHTNTCHKKSNKTPPRKTLSKVFSKSVESIVYYVED